MKVELFCTVVDNFGDIGVTWRLARQLQRDHRLEVRVWVDDLASFRRIEPRVLAGQATQQIDGLEIWHWNARDGGPGTASMVADLPLGEVVVEMFACELPAARIAQMRCQPRPPLWINLEYLSAEAWVEGSHGLASIHPATGLAKTFFFPGFTARTGGLLRERDLAERRTAFSVDDWRAAMGLPLQAMIVSLFCYESAPVDGLIAALAALPQRSVLLVPDGIAARAASQGAVTVRRIPFMPQDNYDELLWACDLNFVRGEDSFVRAQLAGQPCVWQAYEQEGEAHHQKLEAFLARSALPVPVAALWRAWNGIDGAPGLSDALPAAVAAQAGWQNHARQWCESLFAQPDLAANLVKLIREKL